MNAPSFLEMLLMQEPMRPSNEEIRRVTENEIISRTQPRVFTSFITGE